MTALRLGKPVSIGSIELVAIERTALHGRVGARGLAAFATKEPAAIVIRSDAEVWALDLEGRVIAVDNLPRDVVGLREWMQEGLV